MRPRPRRGLSRPGLLVLLAALAFAFGLLAVAVRTVRMHSKYIQAASNLRQVALALVNYSTSNQGKLPAGVDANHFSAAARLLPYLEEEDVHERIDFTKDIDDPANAGARRARVTTFLNPADPVDSLRVDWGPTNYLFNAGSKPGLEDNDGVLFRDSAIRYPDDIPDGTTRTVMVGETLKGDGGAGGDDVSRRHLQLGKDSLNTLSDEEAARDWAAGEHVVGDRCASWMDGRFLQGTFTGTRTVNDDRPDVSCGGAGGLSGLRGVGDEARVALCDGSVRAVTSKVAPEVWRLLTARNDGQKIPDF